MMLELSEERRSLQSRVREFAEAELGPGAVGREERGEFPREAVRRLGRMGVFGLILPAEYGGKGGDPADYAVVVEELARHDASVALSLIAHTLCAWHINAFGNAEQKERYLVPLARGDDLGAWAFSERSTGKKRGWGISSSAVDDGDGWRISGEKSYVTNGADADTFVVLAVTDKTEKTGGISAFIVPGNTPGMGKGAVPKERGFRSSGTVPLVFKDLRLPRSSLLGCENEGLLQVETVRGVSRIGVAAMAVGAGRRSLEENMARTGRRSSPGTPAAEFQAVRWTLNHNLSRSGNQLVSQREREVLEWLKQGKSTWDISIILGISERTVYYHVSNIMNKLGVSNRTQAVAVAASLGLVDVP